MQKNLYYRNALQRNNPFKDFIYGLFSALSTYPRLLLEVFIRKDFGERYFRLSSSITLIIILSAVPFIPAFTTDLIEDESFPTGHYKPDFLWYVFLVAFFAMSVKHYLDMKRNPSVFDFKRYSLSSGKINPIFSKIQIPGIKTTTRTIETIYEPLPFLILGIVLWLLHQKLGILLTVCSVMYSLSYVADYNAGDNFVMDKIDEIICNEELKKSFIDDAPDEETRGFRYMGSKPNDPEQRKQVFSMMNEDIAEAK